MEAAGARACLSMKRAIFFALVDACPRTRVYGTPLCVLLRTSYQHCMRGTCRWRWRPVTSRLQRAAGGLLVHSSVPAFQAAIGAVRVLRAPHAATAASPAESAPRAPA